MYREFRAVNFRGFRELSVEQLHRVNLITGRNNVGKSSLLEAMFIHSGAANVHLPFSIENLRGVLQFEAGSEGILPDLFYNFDTIPTVELTGVDQLGRKTICALRVVPIATTLEPTTGETGTGSSGQAIEITFSDEEKGERFTGRATFERGQPKIDPIPRPPLYVAILISSGGFGHQVDADRFSALVKGVGEEERLLTALQIVDPNIRGVRLLNHAGTAMIHVDIGMKRFLPIAYAGEGLTRIARILVAIASCKNGILFVDEFENGVHYSILSKMWTAVADFADRFNVQVVATSHSLECVRAAHEAFISRDYGFRLFRLQRKSGGLVEALGFDRDAVDAALKTDLELR